MNVRSKPDPLPCRILDCVKLGTVKTVTGQRHWQRSSLCVAHKQRLTRLGSATARRCHRCRRTIDDQQQDTHRLDKQGQPFKCRECLLAEMDRIREEAWRR